MAQIGTSNSYNILIYCSLKEYFAPHFAGLVSWVGNKREIPDEISIRTTHNHGNNYFSIEISCYLDGLTKNYRFSPRQL
jgi:hypothetical protein